MSEKDIYEQMGEQAAMEAINSSRGNFFAANGKGRAWSPRYHAADKRRDMWSVGGFPDAITFDMQLEMYSRNGVAKAGIDIDVNKTWQTFPTITDGEPDPDCETKTRFEQDVEWLIKERDLFFRLKELDRKQMVGRYGGLVVIAKQQDVTTPDKPLTLNSVRQVFNLLPVYESEIDVNQWVTDITKEDYGKPVVYEYRSNVPGARDEGKNQDVNLHPTRVIAYGGSLDGSIYGIPANEAGFNALMDAEKIRIAYSEGGFRQAKGAQVHSIKDDRLAQMLRGAQGDKVREQYNENVERFMKGFDNVLNVAGVDVSTLQLNMNNPQEAWMMCINEYAASRQIPVTILIGQMTGRLASDEDQSALGQKIMSRRNNETSDMIKHTIRHLIEIGAVNAPENEICIKWDDITEPSQGDKLDMANKAADLAVKQAQAMTGEEPIITGEEIRRDILGYTDEPETEADDFEESEDDDS